MVYPSAVSQRLPAYKIWVALFILAIAVFVTVPHYVAGDWNWAKVPELSNVRQLQTLQQQGLDLPGWQTIQQNEVTIGGHQWSVQEISRNSGSATNNADLASDRAWILLRPQIWHKDLPQVDWMDINGSQSWTADSIRSLKFTVSSPNQSSIPIKARFLRGWSQARTYAVVQWYAWNTGGSPAPSDWFWADQGSQWHDRHHTAWVAVSLLIPIKPLGDIETARSEATALAQLVQTNLMQTTLQ